MKKILLSLVGCLLLGNLFSQTTITTDTITTATWTLSGSPYNVDTNIVIPPGNTLTIEAGVEIIIDSAFSITVSGNIIADGIETSPIQFCSLKTWEGIDIIDASDSDSSILNNCVISKSQSSGLSIKNTNKVRVSNCSIKDNKGGSGGGIYISYSDCFITKNTIESNKAGDGGGIYVYSSDINISNNIIKGNSASGAGGGIDVRYSTGKVYKNQIINNSADARGGGIQGYKNLDYVLFINNTIVNNSAQESSGIHAWYGEDVYANNIIWGNSSPQIGSWSNSAIFDHNGIEGEYSADIGQIILDSVNNGTNGPLFSDPENEDFTLSAGSPLIGSGIPSENNIGHTGSYSSELIGMRSYIRYDKAGGTINPRFDLVESGESFEYTLSTNDEYLIVTATYNETDILEDLVESNNQFIYSIGSITEEGKLEIGLSKEYSLTASSDLNGSITPTNVTVTTNLTTNFTITPNQDYILQSLVVNDENMINEVYENNDGSYTFSLSNVLENKIIKANFVYDSFNISISANEGGSIDPLGDTTMKHKDTLTITITPDEGYILQRFNVNDIDIADRFNRSKSNTYNVLKPREDLIIKAEFVYNSFTISTIASEGGTITPSEDSIVKYQDEVYFYITPYEGWQFVSLTMNDEDVTSWIYEQDDYYTFYLNYFYEDVELKATFKEIETNPVQDYTEVNIKVYPVPCRDFLTIDPGNQNISTEISLFNLMGQIILITNIAEKEIINISDLSPGTYIMMVKNRNQTYSMKLIKQ